MNFIFLFFELPTTPPFILLFQRRFVKENDRGPYQNFDYWFILAFYLVLLLTINWSSWLVRYDWFHFDAFILDVGLDFMFLITRYFMFYLCFNGSYFSLISWFPNISTTNIIGTEFHDLVAAFWSTNSWSLTLRFYPSIVT